MVVCVIIPAFQRQEDLKFEASLGYQARLSQKGVAGSWRVRKLVKSTFTEDPGSDPSTYIVAHNQP